MQRFKFHTRTRKPGESIAKFIEELRLLVEFCNFIETLEKMLRDRLVCGNDDIQRRLLAEKRLIYKKAIHLTDSLKDAVKDVKLLGPSTSRKSTY